MKTFTLEANKFVSKAKHHTNSIY